MLNEKLVFLLITSLVPYSEHPFKLYDGEKFEEMCKSIKEIGIIVPIIVRPIGMDNKKYEILSGHNRVNVAKAIGLSEVPAIIKLGLNDVEVKLIVTETNLLQRSFADLSHSERAIVLKTRMDAIKKQGKRNDLIDEVNNFINVYANNDADSPLSPMDSKAKRRDKKIVDKFNISPRSIARYIRIVQLIKPLQTMVDNGKLGIYPAVSLSYLSIEEQKKIFFVIFEKRYKVNMKKAAILRELSQNQELTGEQITEVLSDISKRSTQTSPPIKIPHHVYSKYFNADIKQDEIEDIIDKALYEYFSKTEKIK
jgi:ParB family chromosome partitioning protein